MNIAFNNPKLNEKYIITSEKDQQVKTPKQEGIPAYTGKLSGINDEKIIEGMIDRGSNLVQHKKASSTGSSSSSSSANGSKNNK